MLQNTTPPPSKKVMQFDLFIRVWHDDYYKVSLTGHKNKFRLVHTPVNWIWAKFCADISKQLKIMFGSLYQQSKNLSKHVIQVTFTHASSSVQ